MLRVKERGAARSFLGPLSFVPSSNFPVQCGCTLAASKAVAAARVAARGQQHAVEPTAAHGEPPAPLAAPPQTLQRSERELAAPNSRFLLVEGCEVHYKVERPLPRRPPRAPAAAAADPLPPQQQPLRAVHCLHGFGASAYSWSFVQRELAGDLGATVTAHDMPGFGLTQRWVL